MTLGERIKQVAAERGVSGNELARRIGMDRRTLGRILSGETPNPGIQFVAAIAVDGLGVTLDYLLAGVDEFATAPRDIDPAEMRHLLLWLGRSAGMRNSDLAALLEQADEDGGSQRGRPAAPPVPRRKPKKTA